MKKNATLAIFALVFAGILALGVFAFGFLQGDVTTARATEVDPYLAMHLRFDEAVGATTFADETGVRDAVAHVGTPVITPNGVLGNGLLLDGSTVLKVEHSEDTRIWTSSITINVFARISAFAPHHETDINGRRLFFNNSGLSAMQDSVGAGFETMEDGTVRAFVASNGAGGAIQDVVYSERDVSDLVDQWAMYTFVIRQAENAMTAADTFIGFYINGVLESFDMLFASAGSLFRHGRGENDPFNLFGMVQGNAPDQTAIRGMEGIVDEFRIYTRGLESNEVLALYNEMTSNPNSAIYGRTPGDNGDGTPPPGNGGGGSCGCGSSSVSAAIFLGLVVSLVAVLMLKGSRR